MVKQIILLIVGVLFSLASFADNAHVPCNLTDPDGAAKAAAKKRVDELIRAPSSEIDEGDSDSIDSDES